MCRIKRAVRSSLARIAVQSLTMGLLSISLSIVKAASLQEEISHLLGYVAQTQCRYERNGSYYTGQQAATHIQKKYDYYKDEIGDAETFIELSATKSTMSGKSYSIHCEGQSVQSSKEWLLAELKRYRASLSSGGTLSK